MRRRADLGGQEGFTLVELMAAALVLVVGMLSILSVLNTGFSKTTLNRQRVGATNLAREVTEAARTANYARLTTAQVEGELQSASPSLASTGGSTDWQVKRANATYTIEVESCAYDDPADRIASLPPGEKCSNNPTGTTGDLNGDDFRRLTVKINWTDREGDPTTFQQTTLINNPAGGIGPRILSFPAGSVASHFANFTLTTSYAAAVHWNADDGTSEGDAVRTGTGYTNWAINWNLQPVGSPNAVLDGTYTVTAQALDDRGVAGDTKVSTVVVNRSLPFAPTGFRGGHDTRAGDWVDLEWNLNSERDIVGYVVYEAGTDGVLNTADDRRACPGAGDPATRLANGVNFCSDLNPPSGATSYRINAFDSSAPSNVGASATIAVDAPSGRPDSPATLVVAGTEAPTLTWEPPPTGSPAFYRIYRDGTAIADRIGQTADLSHTDSAAGTHNYYVTAVNDKFNESDPIGPVGWSG